MTIHLPAEDRLTKLRAILSEAKKLAEQQFFDIHISGRETSAEEKEQGETLETCLGYIREALSALDRD